MFLSRSQITSKVHVWYVPVVKLIWCLSWLSKYCNEFDSQMVGDDLVKSIREQDHVDYNKMYIQNRDILSEQLHHVSALIIKDIKETPGHKRKPRMRTTFWNPVLMILFLLFDGGVTKFVPRILWNYPRNFHYFPKSEA